MMNIFKLKTTNRETEELEAISTWKVSWNSVDGDSWGRLWNKTEKCQFFTNENDACKFASSLKQAYNVLKCEYPLDILVELQNNSL